jgi:cation:H+ antiporter
MLLEAVITDSVLLSTLAFVVGIALVLWSTETFIEYVSETAVRLGVSAFLLTVVFAGADWENAVLSLAAVGGNLPGMALGTMVGAAVFVLAVTVGIAGMFTPFEVTVPSKYLAVTLIAPLPLLILTLDRTLSSLDGFFLILAYVPLIWIFYRWETGEDAHYLEAEEIQEAAASSDADSTRRTLVAVGLTGLALGGIVIGSEVTVTGARGILATFGLNGLAFGATILSLVASLEELFLTVEPVRQNRPQVAVGNIVGSTLFFVTVNAGVIALVRPIVISTEVFAIHWPFLLGSLVLVLGFLYRGALTRLEGILLLVVYAAYWTANYVV